MNNTSETMLSAEIAAEECIFEMSSLRDYWGQIRDPRKWDTV